MGWDSYQFPKKTLRRERKAAKGRKGNSKRDPQIEFRRTAFNLEEFSFFFPGFGVSFVGYGGNGEEKFFLGGGKFCAELVRSEFGPCPFFKRRTRISRIHQKKKLSVSRSSANEGGGGFGGLNRNQREGAENGGEEFLKVEKRIPKRSKLEKVPGLGGIFQIASLVWGAFFQLRSLVWGAFFQFRLVERIESKSAALGDFGSR